MIDMDHMIDSCGRPYTDARDAGFARGQFRSNFLNGVEDLGHAVRSEVTESAVCFHTTNPLHARSVVEAHNYNERILLITN